jgi:glycosyltransferase XagB
LGGTSNHFRIDRLRELGGWDPFNVTEDADLGIRASERGYRIGVINSTTFEEANCELDNWVRQRSRWLKGYMQTWLVHTRYPIRSIQRLGIRKWAAVQLFVGGTILSFITTPILWIIFCYWLITRAPWLDNLYPEWVLYLSLFNLIFANALGVYLNMIAVFRRRYYKLIFYSLLNPLYWLLHSVAGYLAIWQLYSRTFYWEKTRHGLSHMTQQRNP